MPNWVEGTFRARGPKENVKKFLTEGFEGPSWAGYLIEIDILVDEYEADGELDAKYSPKRNDEVLDLLYIKETKRQFIDLESYSDTICALERKDGDYIFIARYKGAWNIDIDGFKNLAKKYGIDIKVNGYECGAKSEELVEIGRNGFIRSNSSISYEDWDWECPMPMLGG